MPLSGRDIQTCATIMTTSEPWTRYGISHDSAATLWSEALTTGATVHVARLAEQTVGFAWYIARAGFGLSGYLKLLGVSATARGHGIGTTLLAHTEQLTLADSQRDLLLLVSDFNLAAQRFYQQHGYSRVGALAAYVVPDVTELIYHKRLA
ncbi:MAG TPA: GNAT family N-acetyltransferase [Chloroflexota bacterium]|nr:GNAT family N-acetyltransferase [Chloroflexota bacterium]